MFLSTRTIALNKRRDISTTSFDVGSPAAIALDNRVSARTYAGGELVEAFSWLKVFAVLSGLMRQATSNCLCSDASLMSGSVLVES